jgi:large subunit ribosomal protein L4
MKLEVKDLSGKSAGDLEVSFQIIENNSATQAVHDTVVAYQAAQRSGTACAKTRGEVNGTKKKPYRQKGTGKARAGSFQSPIWVGGGVVFPPRPRDFRKKVNRQTRQLALRKALSERLKGGDVLVVDAWTVETHKTKEFEKLRMGLDILTKSALLVSESADNKNLTLACRNIPDVELTTSDTLNTYQVLRYDKIVISKGAFEKLQQRIAD